MSCKQTVEDLTHDKKKRGRPRKITVDSPVEQKHETMTVQSKRGRPAKGKVHHLDDRRDMLSVKVNDGNLEVVKGDTPDDQKHTPGSVERKRGRPAKVKVNSPRNQEDSASVERKRGRPAKIKASSPRDQEDPASVDREKRRLAEVRANSPRAKEERASDGRQRGQSVDVNVDSPDNSEDITPAVRRKSGRGRKAKLDLTDHDRSEAEDITEMATGQKCKSPGRKKSLTDTKKEYTCVHCGEVKNSSAMSLHMLREHYRVWDPSNPEGTVNLLRAIKRFGKLRCHQCQKQFNSAQYYGYHIKWCGREEERVVCPVCNLSQKAMWLRAHLLEHKRKERQRDQELDKETVSDVSVTNKLMRRRKAAERALEQLKDLDLMDESEAVNRRDRIFKKQSDEYKADTSSASDDDDDDDDDDDGDDDKRMPLGRRKTRQFWADAYLLAKSHHKKYSQYTALPSLMPCLDEWKQIPKGKAECYLPTEKISIKFKVTKATEKRAEGEVGGEFVEKTTELHQLTFGDSHLMKDGFIAYCGGAIWSVDWCPVGEKHPQFLAVACHLDFDQTTPVDRTTTGPGIIQLWSMGHLHRHTNFASADSEEVRFPKLECIMANDDGVSFDLKWCPLGGWSNDTKTDCQQRLGLLAVATSSGYLHIYSIPDPDSLRSQTQTSDQSNVYRVEPSQKLCQNFNCQPDSPCLCVSWSVSERLTRIAAGFGDGTISVWNLSMSTTLDHDTSDTSSNMLWPCITFLAHGAAVSGLDFCPWSPDLLVSCGYERYLRRWDLREPDLPVDSCQLRSKLQHVCWPPYFNIILTVSDQCYAANSTATYCVENRDDSTMWLNFFLHDGCVWDVSFSMWTNAYMVSDVTGDVYYMILPRIWSLKVQQKVFSRRRMSLLKVRKTSLITKPTCEDDKTLTEQSIISVHHQTGTDSNRESSTDKSEAAISEDNETQARLTWNDCLKKYALDFSFFDKNTPYRHAGEELEVADCAEMTEPAAQSINRVVFSPNMLSCSWTAFGGQAGLLCVKNVPNLKDNKPGTMRI